MEKYFIGTRDHGCSLDNDNQQMIYFDLLNLVEKVQGKKKEIVIKYKDIESIRVYGSVVQGVGFGSTSIILEVLLNNKEKQDVCIVYTETTKEELRSFIDVLQASSLPIDDPLNIFETVLTSDERIGTILDNIMKK